jgi:hypothetical protein
MIHHSFSQRNISMGVRHLLSAVVLGAAALTACNRPPSPTQHEALSRLDPIRNAFNADSGKVRAIFLASPT